MVTVGVGDGAIQYVSSSLVRTSADSVPAAILSPTVAWLKAAADVGRDVSLGIPREGHPRASAGPASA